MNIPFRKDQHHHHHGSFDHHITAERNTLGSSSYMSDGAGLLSSSFSNASDLSSSSIGSYNSVNSTNSSLLSTSTAATGWMGMSPPNYVMGFNGGNHSSSSPQPNGYHHTKSQSMNSANNNMTTWLSSSGGNHHHSQQHPNNTMPQQDHHQHFGTSLLSNSHHHQLGTHQRRITTGSSSFDFSSSMDDISLMGHNSSVRGRSAATSTFNSVFGPTQTNSVPTELEIPSRTSVCSNNVMTNMAEEHVDPTMLLLDSPKVGHNHSRSQHLSHDDGINVNMFVRSVVGKVLSDDMEEFNSFHHVSGQQNHHHHHHNYQQQPALNNHLNISPQPSSPLSRRFMSMSCPTVLNSFQNSIGFQLFQQQQQHPLQHDSHNGTNNSSVSSIDFDLIESVIAGDESTSDHTLQGKKPCKYFFSAEGCTYGDSCTFLHSLTPNTRNNPPNFVLGVSTTTTAPPLNGNLHGFSSHAPEHEDFHQNGFVMNKNEQLNAYQYHTMQQYPSNSSMVSTTHAVHGDVASSVNNVANHSNSSQVSHQQQTSNSPPQQQQQICQFFKKGECRFGDKCRNLHLKNKSKLDEHTKKKLKTIRCRFGVNCPFGHECYYFHEQSDFDDDSNNTSKPPSSSTQKQQ